MRSSRRHFQNHRGSILPYLLMAWQSEARHCILSRRAFHIDRIYSGKLTCRSQFARPEPRVPEERRSYMSARHGTNPPFLLSLIRDA